MMLVYPHPDDLDSCPESCEDCGCILAYDRCDDGVVIEPSESARAFADLMADHFAKEN